MPDLINKHDLPELFERLAFNLNVIYNELKNSGYNFKTDFRYTFERPLHPPLPDTENLLGILDELVKPYGFVPESLKMFYRLVGSCNFEWNWEDGSEVRWQYADPLQITSLDDLLASLDTEEIKEMYKETGFVSLPLSADYYHKDNVSGGSQYSIEITSDPSADSRFLYEEHETTFINYLRIVMENCGFSRMSNPENKGEYQGFFSKVKPQLKPI